LRYFVSDLVLDPDFFSDVFFWFILGVAALLEDTVFIDFFSDVFFWFILGVAALLEDTVFIDFFSDVFL